jgi:hypothetical protein
MDFVQNKKGGKTKVVPLEIHVTEDPIAEVTKIPIIGEQWFKEKRIEK